MVATSQPLATQAGLRALERGGNAADAVLAAAAALCIAEPMSTGVGGDAFALVWNEGQLVGLDAAGPAPSAADPELPVDERGPRSVTVPGAVGGWTLLAERFARHGLDLALSDAVDAAERGIAVGAVTAAAWASAQAPPELGAPPRLGERFRLPELAKTLRRIASEGPSGFYEGEIADAIARSSWLAEEDLASYRPRWVEPLSICYRDVAVCELPPPTQGIAVLESLGLLGLVESSLSAQIECIRLALEDASVHVRDGAELSWLLGSSHLRHRRSQATRPMAEPTGGTVYLCAVDSGRMAVSFIQSLFNSFGSGVVAPGTGVVLQNRGACFDLHGRVEPNRRPYHTLIPAMLLRGGQLLGPFGVMGGFFQAQGHVQLVSALTDDRLDPQAALDRPRFSVEGRDVRLEEGLWERSAELQDLGLTVIRERDRSRFGGGQAILVEGDVLVGGSDARQDGYAAGN